MRVAPLLLSCLWFTSWPGVIAAEPPRIVPGETAALLGELAAAPPAEVVRRINALSGELHPLLHLQRAQARWQLRRDAGDAEQRQLIIQAEADFTAAVRADPTLRQCHLGLAQCAAAREDWPTAARQAGLGIDPGSADRTQLAFLASTALQAGDWRVATVAAQQGLLRFQDDAQLRRIELATLIHADRAEDARQAVLALLAQTPDDAQLWRHLAWSAQQTGRDDEVAVALEAALAVAPTDRSLRRSLAEAQLSRQQPQAAWLTIQPLLGPPLDPLVLANEPLLLLIVRCASEGGGAAGAARARELLAAVPESARTRSQRLHAARLAVRAGDRAAAGEALDALIAGGESDPAVLAWAGALAEEHGDLARAEALYLRGSALIDSTALRLAALYLKQQRTTEASTVLATYLAKHPDDAQARALHGRLERKR